MQNESDELLTFQSCCSLDGTVHRLNMVRRNKRPMAIMSNLQSENETEEPEAELWEQEKLYVNLNPVERVTWEKILRGKSVNDIAKEEGVSRQAIYSRIAGNSSGHGGMVAKNFWILLWWTERQKLNKKKTND